MQTVTDFAGQNWLITPAARAVNEATPANISQQKWLLTLSGVVVPNLEGNSDWRFETLVFMPSVRDPLLHAVNGYQIPKPAQGNENADYFVNFQLDQWSPNVALASIYDHGQSFNSGFSVNVWRPFRFLNTTNVITGEHLSRVFTGIEVEVAVRGSNARLQRLSYNISLLGYIVFTPRILS